MGQREQASAPERERDDRTNERRGAGDGSRRSDGGTKLGRLHGVEAARLAREQLEELTGHPADSVSAMTRSDDGWLIRVELVELERVPPTMNVMGSYEAQLDQAGELMGYELIRRYHRGHVGEDE